MTIFRTVISVGASLTFLVLTGCATMNGVNGTAVTAKAGRGEIYLAVSSVPIPELHAAPAHSMRLTALGERPMVRYKGGNPEERKPASGAWVSVTEKNEKGEKLGLVISPFASDKVLREALGQELKAAGYTVRMVRTLPHDAARGIDVSRISFDAEQTTGLFATAGDCTVTISLDLWKNGSRVKRIDNEAKFSDYALYDRDALPEKMMHGALKNLMEKTLPEISREMGVKS